MEKILTKQSYDNKTDEIKFNPALEMDMESLIPITKPMNDFEMIFLNEEELKTNIYHSMLKRSADILVALIGVLLTIPLVLFFCILIKLETPGPAFYFQERVGYRGKCFKIIKLRSMRIDAEKNGAQWAEKNDMRITKIGYFIRKTRIDELPQLINVLKGDMSIIGPRPERPLFTVMFNEEIPGFIKRLEVKPGVTGWAQVNGGYEISPREKLEFDLYYIENKSLVLELSIMIKTFKVMLTGDGAR